MSVSSPRRECSCHWRLGVRASAGKKRVCEVVFGRWPPAPSWEESVVRDGMWEVVVVMVMIVVFRQHSARGSIDNVWNTAPRCCELGYRLGIQGSGRVEMKVLLVSFDGRLERIVKGIVVAIEIAGGVVSIVQITVISEEVLELRYAFDIITFLASLEIIKKCKWRNLGQWK